MLATRRLSAFAAVTRSARTYASASAATAAAQRDAAPHTASAVGTAQAQISKTAQGIRVATYDDLASPAAGLSLVLNAGARHESSETIGLAHYLKNYAFKTSDKRTAFRIAREAELQGAILYSDASRESISYRARFLRGDWAYFAEVLSDAVTKPKFAHYELAEVRSQVQAETNAALANPTIVVLDALHRVAYRTGLGNSLYAPTSASVSADAIRHFQLANLSGLTVVGHGVEHAALVEALESIFAGFNLAPQPTSIASKYHGGDLHLDSAAAIASGNAVCALAFPVESITDRVTARALRHLLGGEKRLKWANGQSPLARVAHQHGGEVRGLNLEYSDAALFGLVTYAPADNIRSAVHEVVAELRKVADGQVEAEAIARALATARFETADTVDSMDARLTKLGQEVTTTGRSTSVADAVSTIASVQSTEIVGLARRLLATRPSLVAAGNPHDLPFADELGF
ncbi:Metalloenzyme, LuxS/M16 peptidase-like protein [Syncephalis fuscata]|nr:Metalloenzyme, LuxS/M16 peptidase-like protein [Syncephalis fuscata]